MKHNRWISTFHSTSGALYCLFVVNIVLIYRIRVRVSLRVWVNVSVNITIT